MATGTFNDNELDILSAIGGQRPDTQDDTDLEGVGVDAEFSDNEEDILAAIGGPIRSQSRDPGIIAQTYAYPAAFIGGGLAEMGTGGAVGIAGILQEVAGDEVHYTPKLQEDLGQYLYENITEPWLHLIGPDKAMDKAHQNIGEAFAYGMDGTAYLAEKRSERYFKVLEGMGIDTTQLRAANDALARTAFVAATFVLGAKIASRLTGKRGQKAGDKDGGGRPDSDLNGFTAEEWAEILRTDVRHTDVPRLTHTMAEGVPRKHGPRLEDKSTTAPRVVEGEWIPAHEATGTFTPAEGARIVDGVFVKGESGIIDPMVVGEAEIVTPMDYGTFREFRNPMRKGERPEVREEYSAYLSMIDEFNVLVQTEMRIRGIETAEGMLANPKMKQIIAERAMQVVKAHMDDVGALMKENKWSVEAAQAAVAGAARLRTSALIAQDHAFGTAMAKFVGMKNFEGMVARLPERTKQELVELLERVGKRKSLGGPRYTMRDKLETLQEAAGRRLGPDAIYRQGPGAEQIRGARQKARTQAAGRGVTVRSDKPRDAEGMTSNYMRREGSSMETIQPTEYMGRGHAKWHKYQVQEGDMPLQFTLEERLAWHRELETLQEGVMLKDGEMVFRDKGDTRNFGDIVTERFSKEAAMGGKPIAKSERGEVYTPGQVQALKSLTSRLNPDALVLSTYRVPALAENAAVVRFRALWDRTLSSEHRYSGKRFDDFGIKFEGEGPRTRIEGTGFAKAQAHAKKRHESELYKKQLEAEYEAAGPRRRARMEAKASAARVKGKYARREAKRKAQAEQRRASARIKKADVRYQTEGRKTPSAQLNDSLAHIEWPTRKDIDGIMGDPRGMPGSTTQAKLRRIWKELGIEKAIPKRNEALRRGIKAHLADNNLLNPGRRKGEFVAKGGKRAPKRTVREMDESQLDMSDFEGVKELNFEDFGPMSEPRDFGINRKGKMGKQRGAVDPSAFDVRAGVHRIVDSVVRKWGRAAEKAENYKPQDGKFFQQDSLGLYKEARHVMGGQVMGPLFERVAIHAKEGKAEFGKLMAMIEQLPRTLWTEAIGDVKSWYQMKQTRIGEWLTSETNGKSLQAVLNQLEVKYFAGPRKYLGAIPKLKKLGFGTDMYGIKPRMNRIIKDDLTSGIAPVTRGGKLFRQYLDRIYAAAEQLGVPVAKYENFYYPPVFKFKEMRKEGPLREQFIAQARRNGLSDNHIFEWMSAMIDGEGLITVKPDMAMGRNKNAMGRKDPNLELNRYFLSKFHPKQMRPFLVDDVAAAMHTYGMEAATRMAYVERFGVGDHIWNKQMDAAVLEANEMGLPLTTREMAYVDMAREIIARNYGRGSKRFAEFQRWGIAFENWNKLGMVVPGSIAEPAIALSNPTMMKHYAWAVGQAGIPTMARQVARAIYRDIGPNRTMQIASDTARYASVQMNEYLTALNAADMGSTWSSLAFVANGQHTMTTGMIGIATGAFESALRRVATQEAQIRMKRWKPGKNRMDEHLYDIQMLKQYGVSVEEALAWFKGGAKLEGAFYQTKFIPAVIKYQNDVVLTPRGVNLPGWMNKTDVSAFRHLLSYVTMFGNKVTPELAAGLKGKIIDGAPNTPHIRNRTRFAALGSMTAIMALAILSEEMMDFWKYGDREDNPTRKKMESEEAQALERILRYMNRSGFLGLPGAKLLDIMEAGAHRKMGGEDVVGGLIGPLWSDVADWTAMGVMAIYGETNAKEVAKQMVNSIMPMQTALPRTERAPGAEALPSKEQLAKAIEDYLVSLGIPRGGKSKKAYRGYGGYNR